MQAQRKTTLEERWPRAQFQEWQAQGIIHPNDNYADYLEMRRDQEEMAAAARREGLTPVEFPEEMTEEDFVVLDRLWAEARLEQLAGEAEAEAVAMAA